ncbi:MAG: glycosyltransferase [Bacteroidales bacterium]|nr:glycosyltransferase [Bacteroidales bacterium]
MIRGKDIIVVGIQPWDISIGSNCKNIAEEYARHNRVLYVNSPLDRFTRFVDRKNEKIKKRIRISKGKEKGLIQISDNLWNLYPSSIIESINWIKSARIFDWLNIHNTRLFAEDIRKAADELGFKDVILFNDSSMFLGRYLKKLLQPTISIYYMRDYLIKNPYWRRHGVRIEPFTLINADLVVNNSTLYAEYGSQHNIHSYMVGQGCDTSLFNDDKNTIRVPDDLLKIPKPILGYVGFLSGRRLDIKLLEYIADNKPEWNIVLVGPEDDAFKVSRLHDLKNVFFLGSRDSSELPSYIKGFDIAMNPQLINDATIGNYPRKIDEYLALGKPTLGSATKAMEYFKDYTYLGVSHQDYVDLAELALKEDSEELRQKRRAFGTSHSWENNVAEINKYIELVCIEKGIKL